MVKTVDDSTYVSMRFFLTVVGLLASLMSISTGWMFVRVEKAEAKVETLRDTNTAINVNLARIQTDIGWIRTRLDEHMMAAK